MRLIWINPTQNPRYIILLQSQFSGRRNICPDMPVRHFCAPSTLRLKQHAGAFYSYPRQDETVCGSHFRRTRLE
ncbi:hypothetical protein LCM4573_14870 [Rhizobium sp. LCM 4573]|nr:hypothetical protein LCM4573_14870 [Rhizobium sp. LCM 4573]